MVRREAECLPGDALVTEVRKCLGSVHSLGKHQLDVYKRQFQLFPAFFREFLALFLVQLVFIRADGVVHFGVHVVFLPLFQREQFIEASEDCLLYTSRCV